MPVIEASGIAKSYRGRALYKDASFTIPEGSITAVTGPNGSGKSVLFRMMCGFIPPDQGTITIDPRYLSPRRTFPDRFGVIIDRPGYLAGRTGMENLLDLARIRKIITKEKIAATMEEVGLDPTLAQKVRNYSLGMKQKLALAQALMEDPDVLVLDEPFNALDSTSVTKVKALLRHLNQAGTTIILTSHNRADIDELADQELIINDGQIHLAHATV